MHTEIKKIMVWQHQTKQSGTKMGFTTANSPQTQAAKLYVHIENT